MCVGKISPDCVDQPLEKTNILPKGRFDLTAVDVGNNVDATTVERDEAESEEYSHGVSGVVCRSSELGNHCCFQGQRDHASCQAGD